MRTSERQRSAAIEGVVYLRACSLQLHSYKEEQSVIEVGACTDHPSTPEPRPRKGAQHPQGVRRIRKAAKPPTPAQRYSTQKEVRNPDTHRLKTSVRRRHTQNAPDQNPKQEQGLSFSTGVSPRGKSKKGARPPFWSPEGVGIPKGRGPCERSFPLGRVFDDFLHEQKVIRVRAGQARG